MTVCIRNQYYPWGPYFPSGHVTSILSSSCIHFVDMSLEMLPVKVTERKVRVTGDFTDANISCFEHGDGTASEILKNPFFFNEC